MGKKAEQRVRVIQDRNAGRIERRGRCPWRRLALINRRLVGEGRSGNFRDNLSSCADAHDPVVGNSPDVRVGQVPFFENLADAVFLSLVHDDEHPLLRFAEQDFVGCHAVLALGDKIEIDIDTAAAAAGRFAGRAG